MRRSKKENPEDVEAERVAAIDRAIEAGWGPIAEWIVSLPPGGECDFRTLLEDARWRAFTSKHHPDPSPLSPPRIPQKAVRARLRRVK